MIDKKVMDHGGSGHIVGISGKQLKYSGKASPTR